MNWYICGCSSNIQYYAIFNFGVKYSLFIPRLGSSILSRHNQDMELIRICKCQTKLPTCPANTGKWVFCSDQLVKLKIMSNLYLATSKKTFFVGIDLHNPWSLTWSQNSFISLAYSYLVTEVKCQCLSICCWYEYKYWLGGHNPNDYCCFKTSGVSSNQGAALTTGDQSQVSNYYVSVWGVSIVRSLTLCPQLETQSQGQDVVSQQTVS